MRGKLVRALAAISVVSAATAFTGVAAGAQSHKSTGGAAIKARSGHRAHALLWRRSVASWYYDAGNTACGFHARYGIANKTLPCGTKVKIAYGRRSLVATVDDRGPYVYGRQYDLDQTVSQRLGMYGVATVRVAIA